MSYGHSCSLHYALPFSQAAALAGNDVATFPGFPAEIRGPQGTLFGVSACQINFGSSAIDTAGDAPDVLVAMNPAALKTTVPSLKQGGLIIADEGEFNDRTPAKAKYEANPHEDRSEASHVGKEGGRRWSNTEAPSI